MIPHLHDQVFKFYFRSNLDFLGLVILYWLRSLPISEDSELDDVIC